MKVGKHSVVMGDVPTDADIGEGCVVIGATDAWGNTILNTPMAVGYGAKASPGSIAIGAFAGAGACVQTLQEGFEPLIRMAVAEQNQELLRAIEALAAEFEQSRPDRSAIMRAWDGVRALATVGGAHALLSQASTALVAALSQLPPIG